MLIEAEPMLPSTLPPGRRRILAPAAIRWLAGCLAVVALAIPATVRAQAVAAASQAQPAQPPHDGSSVPAPAAPPQNAPGKDKPAQGAPAQGTSDQAAPAQAVPAQEAPAQPAPAQPVPAQPAPADAAPAGKPPAPAQPAPAQGSEAPGTETPAVVLDESAADTLLGKSVQSTNGDDMGRVIDVVVDRSGMVRAAIIDFGGFLGIGTRDIAVDWRLLHFAKDGSMQTIVTELTRNQLRTAPVYKQGEPIIIVGRADAPAAAPSQPVPAAPTAQAPAAAVPAAQAPAAQVPAAQVPAAPSPSVPAAQAPAAAPALPAAPASPAAPTQKQKP